jgi:ABC-2 type transport system ATP-binding protein
MEFFRTERVTKVFSTVKALTDISISVKEQSIFGLLGPNGAGKTTLLRIINQITAPDEGKLYLEGRRMKSEDVAIIGYLPEERGLYKKMKVGEQAIYLAQLKGLTRHDAMKSIKTWFERFEITDWWNKKTEELSKGMQQKVQFITTVAHNPKFLIFDEPFSGFDPINASLLKKEIIKLRDDGATVIFSTHDMGSVEELCDHIALINKSVKIVDGPTNEIREKYKSNIFEIKYKGDFRKVAQNLDEHFNVIEHNENSGENRLLVQFKGTVPGNRLLERILPVSEITAYREIIPGMNDVFIKAVQEDKPQNIAE